MEIQDIKLKFVKSILIVISLGLLSQPWIVVCDDYEYTWEKSFDYVEDFIDTWGVLSLIGQYDETGTEDEYVNVDDIEEVIECLSDGEFTAIELSRILEEAEKLVSILNDVSAEEMSYQAGVTVFASLYQIVFWSVIILGCIQIYCIWFRGQAGFENGFYFSQITLIFLSATLCGFAYSEIEEWIIRPTVWAVLAVICSVPTDDIINVIERVGIKNYTISVTEDFKPEMHNTKTESSVVNSLNDVSSQMVTVSKEWSCRGCNTGNNSNARFCVKCGKKKAEIVICEICGYKKWDDEPCKNCAKVVAQNKGICSSCGCRLEEGSIFCQYCGKKVN